MAGVTMLGVEDGIVLSSGRQDKAWPQDPRVPRLEDFQDG